MLNLMKCAAAKNLRTQTLAPLAASLVSAVSLFSPSAYAGDLRGEVQLDSQVSPQGSTRSTDIQLTSDGRNFYAVWTEYQSTKNIYFSRSMDGGKTWSPELRLDGDDIQEDVDPVIFADDDRVIVAWLKGDPGQVWAVTSSNSGQSFGAPMSLSESLSGDSSFAVIAGGGDCVVVAFRNDHDAEYIDDLWAVSSENGGSSFSDPVRVNDSAPGTQDISNPQICYERGCFYVTWEDNRGDDDIYFSRSMDGGMTWEANISVGMIEGLADADDPSIAADGDRVVVAWADNRNSVQQGWTDQIFCAISHDNGATFSAPALVGATPPTEDAGEPSCAISGDKIYIAWEDERYGSDQVFVAASIDGGQSFNEVQMPLPDGYTRSQEAMVVADGDSVYVAYSPTLDGIARTYLAVSERCGAPNSYRTFEASSGLPIGLDADPASVAISNTRDVVVMWKDKRSDVNDDVYINGSRFPMMNLETDGSNLCYSLEGAEPSDEGRLFMVVFSETGTDWTALPGGDISMCLTVDATTYLLFQFPSLFADTIENGTAQTIPAPLPTPLYAVGLIYDVVSGEFVATTDPILAP